MTRILLSQKVVLTKSSNSAQELPTRLTDLGSQAIGLLFLALLGIYSMALTKMDGVELTSGMWERRRGDFMLARAPLAYVIYFLEHSIHSKRGLQAEE